MYRLAAFILFMTAFTSCGPKDPETHYDANTGLVGVTTEPGALAGTWGVVIEWAQVVTLPLVGDRNGGSQGLRIWKRTWHADRNEYSDEFRWCTDDVFEVEGAKTVISESLLAVLDPVQVTSTAAHDAGTYTTATVIDIWGLRNLPDRLETPLPTKDNYTEAPQSDWMWDQDSDGHPGVTVNVTGSLEAEAYIVQRSVFSLEGTVLSADRIRGLGKSQKTNQNTVDASTRLAEGESRTHPDPDPKASWFDMVRLQEGATCDDVKAALADGRLAKRQPF